MSPGELRRGPGSALDHALDMSSLRLGVDIMPLCSLVAAKTGHVPRGKLAGADWIGLDQWPLDMSSLRAGEWT